MTTTTIVIIALVFAFLVGFGIELGRYRLPKEPMYRIETPYGSMVTENPELVVYNMKSGDYKITRLTEREIERLSHDH